jgi:hypothetical protein
MELDQQEKVREQEGEQVAALQVSVLYLLVLVEVLG